ncbi:RDD family protein, partial [bacterium]|nr:RDD family protein [bacterium]
YFIKDGLGNGQSWGKRAVGLMVVQLIDDTPCTKLKSSLRGLVTMLLGAVPFGSFVEPIMVIATKDGRRLADMAAETKVIHIENYRSGEH